MVTAITAMITAIATIVTAIVTMVTELTSIKGMHVTALPRLKHAKLHTKQLAAVL